MKKAILILSVLTVTCSLALAACGGDDAAGESATAPDSVQDGNPMASGADGTQTRYTEEASGSGTDADGSGHNGSDSAADGSGHGGSGSDADGTGHNGTASDTVPGADTLPGAALDSVMDQLRTEIDLSGNLSFSAQTAFGEVIDSSVFSGYDLTMINIWGTLCKPCIEEMPDLQKLYEDMAAEGVNIIGFVANYQEDRVEKAQEILTAKGITYSNVVFDDETSGAITAQISGFPTTIFVDSQGNVIGEQISGARGYEEYRDIIYERLEECASWQE